MTLPARLVAFALLAAAPLAAAPEPPADAPEPSAALPTGFYPPPANAPAQGEGLCPDCEGRGKREVASAIDSGENGTSLMRPCPRCGGRGRCVRPLTPDERQNLQRRSLNAYEREQRAARRVPVGAGFMDLAAERALDPAARASLAARFPKRCRTCLGLGKDSCRKCKGLGKITRRERVEEKDGSSRYEEVREVCASCGGTGAQPCHRCDGSGLAKVCSRCNGLGTVEVEAKRDTPAHTERCRSCKGDGRR